MSTHRFTQEDAQALEERVLANANAALSEGVEELMQYVTNDLDRLGVDKEALVSLVGIDASAAAGLHLGLLIAEYQREAEQQREAVPA